MTRAEVRSLLRGAGSEPIAPENDPVWEEAASLLRSSSAVPQADPEAVARTVRAVRLDSQTRKARNWVPLLLVVLASASAFFALAESMAPRLRGTEVPAATGLGSYFDSPDLRR